MYLTDGVVYIINELSSFWEQRSNIINWGSGICTIKTLIVVLGISTTRFDWRSHLSILFGHSLNISLAEMLNFHTEAIVVWRSELQVTLLDKYFGFRQPIYRRPDRTQISLGFAVVACHFCASPMTADHVVIPTLAEVFFTSCDVTIM